MGNSGVLADSSVDYDAKEAAIIVAATAWVIAIGSVAIAALMICGWKGAKSVVIDWLHGKATFMCR
ncbi:MAG: hypothetical protein NTX11_04665 [Candidatus Saccharibacteria bacterium]|nr:hypothetical protein [Candidatus Saccharibacteria bacterium]